MDIQPHGGLSRCRRRARSRRYILPQFEERTAYGFKRLDPYTKLFEDRIIFLGVQVDDASADDVMAQLHRAGEPGPRPRHHHVHQLAGRVVHGPDGHLRHDAVREAGHSDRMPRPGRVGGGGAAGGRHEGQAPRAAERPGADPPAGDGGRRLRPGVRHRDPGQRGAADAHLAGGHRSPCTPTGLRSRSRRTSSATRSSPRRRPWSTVWSTRCWAAARPARRYRAADTPTTFEVAADSGSLGGVEWSRGRPARRSAARPAPRRKDCSWHASETVATCSSARSAARARSRSRS